MIISNLIGGLGNQMFQYALGRKLSKMHKTGLRIDISGFQIYHLRQFELNDFNIKTQALNEEEKNENEKEYNKLYFNKFLKKIGRLPYYMEYVVNEKGFRFDKNIFKTSKFVYLNGYWQSELYFKDIRDELLNEFSLKSSPSKTNKEILKEIESYESVAIHIRRGDYIKNKQTNAVHGVCSKEYYSKAIKLITTKLPKVRFFIFSDDIQWCKKNYGQFSNFTIIDNSNKGIEDMMLMSRCKHFIIANSSFSWWGAWLGRSKDKIIICPQKWFNIMDNDHDTTDLIPREWIKL